MTVQTLTTQTRLPVSADELFAWHTRPGALERLAPPWEDVRLVSKEGEFGNGQRVVVRTPLLGPFRTNWTAEVFGFEPGREFHDRQIKGPFSFFEHTHRMIPDGSNASILDDTVEYRVPLGWLGRLVAGRSVRTKLERMFAYRHRIMLSDLKRHNAFRDRPRLTVAITGSRGLLGNVLTRFLTTGGHRVVRLVHGTSHTPIDDGTRWVSWNPKVPLDPKVLEGCDAIVHLAGDNIVEGRWTKAKKQRILESRTGPTRRLAEAAASLDVPPKVFISASGISAYGDRGDEELTEDSSTGSSFLADVVLQWEAAAEPARAKGIRTVHPRIGVVLSPAGGALAKQLFAFKMGMGATLGSGKQWVPWIAIDDVIGSIHHAMMTDSLNGPYNCCAPNPVSNRTFGKTLGRVMRRPVFMWIPGFALRTLLGGVADDALLASVRAVPRKLKQSGFAFDYTELEPALRHLMGR